jgi:DNA-binding response OmpR family regulator
MRLLLAEDRLKLLDILKKRLTQDGFYVDAVSDGETAIDYLESTDYALIILDIMMPKKSGLEVLNYIRSKRFDSKVLLLTALDKIEDRVKGLNEGADDYLIKPFAYEELLARINALLRRQETVLEDIIKVGNLVLNRSTKTVQRENIDVHLTKKEFVLLEYLMRHENQIVSKETLEAISTNYDNEPYSNVINVYMRFLRKKIDDPFKEKLIHTVRGYGYMVKKP